MVIKYRVRWSILAGEYHIYDLQYNVDVKAILSGDSQIISTGYCVDTEYVYVNDMTLMGHNEHSLSSVVIKYIRKERVESIID
jgi:hypothetical protein